MYELFLPFFILLVPFFFIFYMAIEIYLRNPKNKFHWLSSATILSCGISSYLTAFLQYTISFEKNEEALLIIKYVPVFTTLTLGLYFFRAISKVYLRPVLLHSICLFPLLGLAAILYNPDWLYLTIMQDHVWQTEVLSKGFAILLWGVIIYFSIWIFFFLFIAKRKLHGNKIKLKERFRIKVILKGWTITFIYILLTVLYVELITDRSSLFIAVLPSYCVLIWAYSIRYAMIKFDFLAAMGRRYELLFEMSHQGIVLLDEQGKIVEENPAFQRLSKKHHNIGTEFVELLEEQSQHHFMDKYQKCYSTLTPFQLETGMTTEEGLPYVVNLQSDYLELEGQIYTFIMIQDISEQKKNEKELSIMAFQDSLTRLGNRREFINKLKASLDRMDNEKDQLVIMLLDLDQFKWINDTLGHSAGDLLLQLIAGRLQMLVPDGTVVSRLGGDEFAILYEHISTAAEAEAFADRMLKELIKPFSIYGKVYTISASIGICIAPIDGEDFETLIRNADAAMYLAKKSGRNRYRLFSPSLNALSEHYLAMVNGLSAAIEYGELSLHYQPQIDLQSNQIFGVEALLRWNSHELGTVSPAEFIPIAEETGSILTIGKWVLQTGIKQAKQWIDSGHKDLVVSINLSAYQLLEPEFVSDVINMLEEIGLPPRNLCLEITESMAIYDEHSSLKVCTDLVQAGIGLSIDDFGVGYSSISMLNRFPFQTIKIDRSLIRDIASNKRDLAIIQSVIDLSGHLNLQVIAEGVETEAQLASLRNLHCQAGQGFFWAKPMSIDQMNQYLED